MYSRFLEGKIREKFFKGKVILIAGARQTGKTTLALKLVSEFGRSVIILNGDNPTDRELLNNRDFNFLKNIIGDAKIVFIDEGQKIETIGQTLKLLIDNFKDVKQIIVTGSSAFNLLDKTQEPLTGRKFVFNLYPLAVSEIYPSDGMIDFLKELEILLIYGNYPEVVSKTSFSDKQEALVEITSSYLYKDILELQKIKNPDALTRILKALALQIGSEVSYTELSNIVGIDKKTVERYIDILEKNYILFRVYPYAKNKRKIISKLKKIYFWDIGIRNAIINNFNLLSSRGDIGHLWENFIVAERLKYRSYHKILSENYFWKTYDGSEIDLVEDRDGKLYGYEMKWGISGKKVKIPPRWKMEFGGSFEIINPESIKGFIL